MNFLKKLLKILLVLVLWAGIGFGFWHLYGDQAMEEIDSIQNSIDEEKENAVLTEQNKDFLAVLETVQTHLDEARLIECNIHEYTDEDRYWVSTAAWDKDASKYRQVTGNEISTVTDILGENFMLSSGRLLQEFWTKYEVEGEYPCTSEIYHYDDENGDQYIRADWDQWYFHWDNQSFDFLRRRFGTLPLYLVEHMIVVDYAEVDMEECASEQAMHYIVTHRPIFNWVDDLEQQYNIWDETTNTTTFYAPKEYFETVIQQEVKDGYPELYQAFMELVDKRFYQDNQTHMWITEDGRLLKMEIDFTLDAYEYAITADYEDLWMTTEKYDAENDHVITAPTAFAQLLPVTREIYFTYDGDVEPVVAPSEYIDLTRS